MAQRKPQESKVMKIVNMAGCCIMLNFVFLICCIPVVTFGPACCGLYSGVRYMVRGDGCIQGFKAGFRTNFLRTMIAGILSLLVIAYLVFQFNTAFNIFNRYGDFKDMIIVGVLAIPALLIITPLWILNVYIPYTGTDWLKNAVNLGVRKPHIMLLSAAITWCPVVMFLWLPELFWKLVLVFVGASFALSAFVTTLFVKDELILMLYEFREGKPFDPNDPDDE